MMIARSYFLSVFLAVSIVLVASDPKQVQPKSPQHRSQFWVESDYILMWMKDSPRVEPLVIADPTSEDPVTPILGNPGIEVVLGDQEISNGVRSGFQGNLGGWLSPSSRYGIEAGYLFLCGRTETTNFSSNSSGMPPLGISFFNVQEQAERGRVISIPNGTYGESLLSVRNWLQDAQANALFRFFQDAPQSLSLFSGFFWLNFNEKMVFKTKSPKIATPGDIWQTTDTFRVQNNFYGGQVGLEGGYQWKKFFFNGRAQVALGAVVSHLNIQGRFLTNEVLGTLSLTNIQEYAGGYYALPTNIGSYRKSFFSVIPQVSIQAGYCLRDWCNLHLGYQFLYVSKLMWASNQVDHNINPSQSAAISTTSTPALVGPEAPKALFRTSDFWVQGLTAGVEFSF